ncbi:hypothetical protein J5Y04_16870 [Kitasatospora sp. RG8]|uniref:hypothetical protein n=1 Tax=Kitasatospora sp. RG8 TaxID=2820815 RepID=UPI001ADF372B|nr:hypothetical protein [Kitasatospora sp. RG8]MBP0451201.1 hypothetical protein [Kitasatospora sp. RG8]
MAGPDDEAVLVLDRVPIYLPDPLARLLTDFANRLRPPGWAANHPSERAQALPL